MASTTTNSREFLSDRIVVRIAQVLAFVAAVAIFPMSLLATIKFATSPFEVFVGVVLGRLCDGNYRHGRAYSNRFQAGMI